MGVHPKVITQDMARDPLDHAFFQPCVDHPAQRLCERRIADNPFYTGPEAKNCFGVGEGGEVTDRAVRRIDDVIDIGGIRFQQEVDFQTLESKGRVQGGLVDFPLFLRGGEECFDHGRSSRFRTVRAAAGLARTMDMGALHQSECC